MKLLYGTGNQVKLTIMKKYLAPLELEIIGLTDIDCNLPEVDESGNSPLENAKIKALSYYNAVKIPTFSCDSGLYIEKAPEELQPGVHVRNINGKCLDDDEMIKYYSSLAKRFGGNIKARYKNAICLVMSQNEIYEYSGDDIHGERFIITEKPHKNRKKGFPLDSLSVHIQTKKYYFDLIDYNKGWSMEKGFCNFFTRSLF